MAHQKEKPFKGKFLHYKRYLLLAMLVIIIAIPVFFYIQKERQKMIEQKDWFGWSVTTKMSSYTQIPFGGEAIDVGTYIQPLYLPNRPDRQSYFYTNDGKVLVTMDYANNGWGVFSDPLLGASYYGPVPDRMHLVYENYRNKGIYELDVALPKEEIMQMRTNKGRGITDLHPDADYRVDDWSKLVIGFVGDDYIILYLGSTRHNLKEVGYWQATKVADRLTREEMAELADTRAPEVIDELMNAESPVEKNMRTFFPNLWKRYQSGEWRMSPDWYKMMQTRFPWNLEVVDPTGDWLGEYEITYMNLEHYATLGDQLEQHKKEVKPIPLKIRTWVFDKPLQKKYFLEIHTIPSPRWAVLRTTFPTYGDDPNAIYLYKRFEYFFPNRSLATNNTPAKPEEFATLKIILDDNGKMGEIYLEKNGIKLPIEGAYHYYLAEVDPDQGGYYPYDEGFEHFLTEPKIKDLSDPERSRWLK